MDYAAHIRIKDNGLPEVQSVSEHCRNCARYASEKNVIIQKTAYLAGLLHDMGKYTNLFCGYIHKSAGGEQVRRGSVNHTFAGVRFAMERWHTKSRSFRDMVCELIAFAAGAHHGLFDGIDPDGKDGYLYRMQKDGIFYEEAKENFLTGCASLEELDKLFDAAEQELTRAFSCCQELALKQPARQGQLNTQLLFYISMLGRLLLSSVIDGDRRDTAEFMQNISRPAPPRDMKFIWTTCLTRVEQRLESFSDASKINSARRTISQRCRDFSSHGNGIYRLSVPTGGGKTLASLRYALAAALTHDKKRIFFVVPLLSVLEQNAATIRSYINDDSLILEHHSNIVRQNCNTDELDDNELLMETWDSPVVITTLVQLLNTLFSGRTSCIRRMGSLSDSVIIIDEIQSVPRKLISGFNLALNFLSYVCNATIVLCSATQPCFEDLPHPVIYAEPSGLMPYDPALWAVFRRAKVTDRRKKEAYTARELADLATECAAGEGSVLLICNTKAQAREIFCALPPGDDSLVFHLSTAMCMAHRIDTLKEINRALEEKKRVICISTQLVEAGVDFSFGCVIRISAGIDNVVQAAGRCNRNWEFGHICPVYIVNFKGENLARLKEIAASQIAAESVLLRYSDDPGAFEDDLISDAAIRAYYHQLYTEMNDEMDDPVPKLNTTLLKLLSTNETFVSHCLSRNERVMAQAFATAGEVFSVFDDHTQDVLAPYGEGIRLTAELCGEKARYDLACRKNLLDQLKPYSVSLYDYELKHLQKSGGIDSVCEKSVLILNPDFYAAETGFDYQAETNIFMEV